VKINLLNSKSQIQEGISKGLESLDKEPLPALSNQSKRTNQEERNNIISKLQSLESVVIDLNKSLKKITLLKEKDIAEPNLPVNKPSERLEPVNPIVIDIPLQKAVQKLPDYFIGIKAKNSEIFAVPLAKPDTNIKIIKLNSSSFLDTYSFPTFPLENSRFVYIKDSILVTGGSEKNIAYEKCYLINNTNINDPISVSITNYAPMREKRERHNIIYLEHIAAVIVCSGFYTKSCEINYLNSNRQEWELLQPLREHRANATLFCVNNRFLYCVGGFQVIDKELPKGGVYLNSLEYLDTSELRNGWKFVDLMSLNISLKLCAMGVINVSSDKVLLVGGYDGEKYLTELNECIFDQNGILTKINQKGPRNELGKGVIFTSNQKFSDAVNNKMINFDSNCRLISYDKEKGTFGFKF